MSVRNDNNVGVACSPAQIDKTALKKSIFVLSGVAGATLIAAVVTTILATTILAVAIGPILFGVVGATCLVIAILVGVYESSTEKNGKEIAGATAPVIATQETTQETTTAAAPAAAPPPVIKTATPKATERPAITSPFIVDRVKAKRKNNLDQEPSSAS